MSVWARAAAWSSLVVGAWLCLAAVPVLADGGPHVAIFNNGSMGLNADSCAGCHRFHSASTAGGYLLGNNQSVSGGTLFADTSDFCLTCHGATGSGATTDVATGVQYAVTSPGSPKTAGAILGALRSGGFIQARIGSGAAYRIRATYDTYRALDFVTKVPVALSPSPVTSAHLAVSGSPVSAQDIAWGNGYASFGSTLTNGMECTTCHNPHGNGQYRILNPLPAAAGLVAANTPVNVYDAPLPTSGDTRNYTVIQTAGTTGNWSSFLLLASQVQKGGYASSSGDYWHRFVPWSSYNGALDAPNGVATNLVVGGVKKADSFDKQMTAWCTTCHTRYMNIDGPAVDEGDPVFTYQHLTTGNMACTTCHVAHGSNAVMNTDPSKGTTYSANQLFPGQTSIPSAQVGNSRLLKMDGRGTCLGCHDPTGMVTQGQAQGTRPSPYLP
ncbi:MAG TPA: hypothetical protein VF802_01430 [Candidatus Limnocylindrales bacterium]